MTRALAPLVTALLVACAAPANAMVLGGGEIDRGEDGGTSLDITISNGSDSGELFQAARIELPAGAGQVSDVTTPSGAPASCAPGAPAVIQCQFPPPYLHPGETVEITLSTEQAIADEASAELFACTYPCMPPYIGPFNLVGPFPSKAPPINADLAVGNFRSKRMRAGDRCSPAKRIFGVALGAACVAKNGAAVRTFVVNPTDTPLSITVFGPGWVRRVRIPANGGAGFIHALRLRKPGKLRLVNGADGARTSLPMRLPAKLKRR